MVMLLQTLMIHSWSKPSLSMQNLENALLDGQQANDGEQIMLQSQGDTIQQVKLSSFG